MQTVTIRRCPVCGSIRQHTETTVVALRRQLGVEVEVVDGERGEFTVLMDGRVLANKKGEALPGVDQVVEAVRDGLPAKVG